MQRAYMTYMTGECPKRYRLTLLPTRLLKQILTWVPDAKLTLLPPLPRPSTDHQFYNQRAANLKYLKSCVRDGALPRMVWLDTAYEGFSYDGRMNDYFNYDEPNPVHLTEAGYQDLRTCLERSLRLSIAAGFTQHPPNGRWWCHQRKP